MQHADSLLGDFFCFNLTLGIWIQLTDDIMHGNPPYWRSGFGFASLNSLLYVFGGNGSSGLLPLSPVWFSWNEIVSCDSPTRLFLAHLTVGLLAGLLNDLHQFDPSTNSWLQLNISRLSLLGDVFLHFDFILVYEHMIFFCGHKAKCIPGSGCRFFWLGFFSFCGSPPSQRSSFGFNVAGDSIYVFGGLASSGLLE